MEGVPVALEFRNQTWFSPYYREKTLEFMAAEGWIHSICDEPQAGQGSVPTVLDAVGRSSAVVRFHGRNAEGWNRGEQPNWRDVRYLYDYSTEELAEWKSRLEQLQASASELYVIFNNNSGGHAAGNAKTMMKLLCMEAKELPPVQLELDGLSWDS